MFIEEDSIAQIDFNNEFDIIYQLIVYRSIPCLLNGITNLLDYIHTLHFVYVDVRIVVLYIYIPQALP